MCVIAFSPKGVACPSEDKIKAMFKANPDGAGLAYNGEGGEVFYEKGFMTVDELLERLRPLEQWTNTNLAIHFRIGTAGKNDAHTCHPFPLSTDFGELRKTSGSGPVLFHNGVLAQGGLISPLSSDTQDFVVAFAPLLAKHSKSKVRDAWLEELVKGSRLLIMYKDNRVKMYGDWHKDGDIFVSNEHYKAYEWSMSDYGYSYPYGYGGWYGSQWATKSTESDDERDDTIMSELEKADDLWNQLFCEGFLWAAKEEMDLLIKYSDEHTKSKIMRDGYAYMYDTKQMLVWDEGGEW